VPREPIGWLGLGLDHLTGKPFDVEDMIQWAEMEDARVLKVSITTTIFTQMTWRGIVVLADRFIIL